MKTGVIFLLTTEIPQTVFRKFLGGELLLWPAVPCSAGLYATCLISIFIRAVPVLPLKKGVYSFLQLITEIFQTFYADYIIVDKRNDVVDKICPGHLQLDTWISFVTSYPLVQLPILLRKRAQSRFVNRCSCKTSFPINCYPSRRNFTVGF